jgi:hypothetical protein
MPNHGGIVKATISNAGILTAIVVTVLTNTASIIMPAFLTALSHTRGLTEAQGGLFAMAEFGGIGIGAMACALLPGLVERLNWRRTAALGLVAVIAANLAMAAPLGFYGLFALGLVAGIGGGLVNAVFYATCAEGDGARLVAAFYAAQIGFGAVGVGVMSPIVDRYGDAGLFLAMAALAGAALLLCPLLPPRSVMQPSAVLNADSESDRISGLGWAASLGVFIFFVSSGATYGFIGYMGLAWGGKPAAVESALSGVMYIGMAGPLIVAFVGSRFGYLWPLGIGIAGTGLALVLFIAVKPVAAFLPIGGLLFFAANAVVPCLFDVLTDVDRSSGAAMMMGASQLGGVAIGPAIAGYLATPDYVRVNGFALVLLLAATLIVLGVVWVHQRQGNAICLNTPDRLEA